ncbi:MAG: SUMF1/EgtB/PvdO family nonheme iron enzyme [Anaerolineae bacterium]|nr:SUMF1/EgtB/PvdO family nonheme iron enzyme [Anaerolineae bacterium]
MATQELRPQEAEVVVPDAELDLTKFTPTTYISYYKEDSKAFAEAMRDWLSLRFGASRVLFEIEVPPFVESFEYYIRDKIIKADVVLALIGPDWTQLITDYAERNLRDKVRSELRVSLQEDIVIAPICVLGASPPREIDLPNDLKSMLRYNFTILDEDSSIEEEIEAIVASIRAALSQRTKIITPRDFEPLFRNFQDAYQVNDITTALHYLREIEALGELPRRYRPFKLQIDRYRRDLNRRIQVRDARPRYFIIKRVATKNRREAWEMLQLFLTEYPEFGDPDNLATKLRPMQGRAQQLAAIVEDATAPLMQRIEAAHELAEIGDSRPGVGLRSDSLPDIKWIKIPAGEFIQHFDRRLDLPTFYISRYPITYMQYQAFIDDGGYERDEYWAGLARHERNPQPQEFPIANHPRDRISWFECMAFCRW